MQILMIIVLSGKGREYLRKRKKIRLAIRLQTLLFFIY